LVGNTSGQITINLGAYLRGHPSELSSSGNRGRSSAESLAPVPAGRSLIYGREALLGDLCGLSEGVVVPITGSAGAGKTEVLAHCVRRFVDGASGLRESQAAAIAYVDLAGYSEDETAVLRAVASHLDLKVSRDLVYGVQPDEQVADMALGLARKLDGRSLWLLLDHCDSVLARPSGPAALQKLLNLNPLRSSRVVVVVRTPPATWGTSMRLALQPPVPVRELDVESAGDLLSEGLGVPKEVGFAAAALLDPRYRLPGVLWWACSHPVAAVNAGSVEGLALGVMEAADERLDVLVVSAVLERSDEEHPAALAAVFDLMAHAALVGAPGLLDDQDTVEVLGAFFPSVPGADSAIVADYLAGRAPELIRILISRDDVFSRLVVERVREQLGGLAPEEIVEWRVERLLGVVRDARTELARTLVASLAEVLVLQTRTSAMGPVRAHIVADVDEAPLNTFLSVARQAATPQVFKEGAIPIVDTVAVACRRSPAGVATIRQALLEIEGRFDFHFDINLVRQQVAAAVVSEASGSEGSAEIVHLLVDEARALHKLGQYDAAGEWRQLARNALAALPESLNPGESELVRCRVEMAALELGRGNVEQLRAFEARVIRLLTDPLTSISAGTLLVGSVGAAIAFGLTKEEVLFRAERAGAEIARLAEAPGFIRLVSRWAAELRSFALRLLDGEERNEVLGQAIEKLRPYTAEMRMLAESSSDNRALLAYCRCLISLSKSQQFRGRANAGSSRREALSHLSWLVEANPSSAAWLVYLQTLSLAERYESDWEDDAEQLLPHEDKTFAQAFKQYRRWRRERSGAARDSATEAWAMKRSWTSAGSLIAVCSGRNPDRWTRLPALTKIDALNGEYARRLSAIEGCVKTVGFSADLALLRVRLEAQYQRSIALYKTDKDVDNNPVDELFAKVREKLGPLPTVALAEAFYRQYIWDFEGAILQFRNVQRAVNDRRVFNEAKIGEAVALLQSVTYAGTQDDSNGSVESMYLRVLELTSDLAASDRRASLALLRAKLEQERSLGLPILEEMVDLFSASLTYTTLMNKYADLLVIVREEIQQHDESMCGWLALTEDFTDPRVLLDFGSTFLRAHQVVGAGDLRYLRAALCCLDGARVMSQGGARGIRQPFLVAKTLLTAVRHSGQPTPLGWSALVQEKNLSDIEYAARLFQSVCDRSVGGFRRLIRGFIEEADDLRRHPDRLEREIVGF
jgi:hypothetical protein